MDKKKFVILLITVIVTIFVSIFFSFWFFFGDKTPKNNFPNDIATPDFAGMNQQFDQINKIIGDQQIMDEVEFCGLGGSDADPGRGALPADGTAA